ncbi:TfoX/Sxy family protein [Azospirillum doebereinerae]|uniref:TfoX family protein n=1 Tax=Azospirillum doebereinerae TaxID=92933 RepID=A0A433J4R6_9PROT|nr:TfoX/Sxy family protein [Azospirillum doebereinerae]MCG5239821.1 TfoX/Sxy family protein [Azospirillum doebereinerae]RUQ67206.1 TfoX family protein [Azospirillum doebereinerae]
MPARPPSEFVVTVCETLAALGDVRARRMFGGYGISCDGLTFALVSDDTLYFKVDDANRASYEALGLEPFRPFTDRPTALSYRPPPDSALDDPRDLLDWARPALEAALRAAARKGRSKGEGR